MFCGVNTSAGCSLTAPRLSPPKLDLLQFARPITPTDATALSPVSVKHLVEYRVKNDRNRALVQSSPRSLLLLLLWSVSVGECATCCANGTNYALESCVDGCTVKVTRKTTSGAGLSVRTTTRGRKITHQSHGSFCCLAAQFGSISLDLGQPRIYVCYFHRANPSETYTNQMLSI